MKKYTLRFYDTLEQALAKKTQNTLASRGVEGSWG